MIQDPAYFAQLYLDPNAWGASSEVALLDVYLQYSTFHTSADRMVRSLFEDPNAAYSARVAASMGQGSTAALPLRLISGGGLPVVIVAMAWGQPGRPDHQRTVANLRSLAESEFAGQDVVFRESVSMANYTEANGFRLDRRPDVSVWSSEGNLLKVYEAARVDQTGNFVPREQLKMYQYYELGIPYFFNQVK